MTWRGPMLGKRAVLPGSSAAAREYLPITWEFVLALRAWCRWVAAQTGCRAYLVGSALEKDAPRDVDIALVWPLAEYERHFGAAPQSQEEYEARSRTAYQYAPHAFVVSAWRGVGYKPYIDVHLCSDAWYPNRPRVLLGAPGDDRAPPGFGSEDFLLRTVVGRDDEWLFDWSRQPCWNQEAPA